MSGLQGLRETRVDPMKSGDAKSGLLARSSGSPTVGGKKNRERERELVCRVVGASPDLEMDVHSYY